MEVIINDVVSKVQTVDSNSLLTPQVLRTIVSAVMEAIRDEEEHRRRVRSELRITGGVREELEEEGR